MSDSERRQPPDTSPDGDPPEAAARLGASKAGIAAAVAGFAGLLMYRFVIGDPVLRYLIPLADGVAIALVIWLIVSSAWRRSLDMVIGALATAGVSLYLFVTFIASPSPAAGGT